MAFVLVDDSSSFLFNFLLLVKDAKDIILERPFFLSYDVTTIYAFPRFEIKKMIKECLDDHKTITLWTFHIPSPFLAAYPPAYFAYYRMSFHFVNETVNKY